MRINHNISALKANNILGKTNNSLDKSLEKLSSGYRINRAADDAAGMAISQKMRTQIQGLDQASRNASDGISVIQTAEGALTEVESMLQRMRELSVQAANGTNTTEDRTSIQQEINQLNEEINRISSSTEFNTKNLLDGNVDRKSYSNNSMVELISLSDTVGLANLNITITQDARQAVLSDFTWPSIDEIPSDVSGTLNINGYDIPIKAGQSMESMFEDIRNACDAMNIKVFGGTAGGTDPEYAYYEQESLEDATSLIFVSDAYGSSQKIEIHCNNENLCNMFGLNTDGVTVYGVDAKAELGDGFSGTATVSANGNIITVTDRDDFEVKFKATAGAAETSFTDGTAVGDEADVGSSTELEVSITVLDAGPMDLQIGANEGQTMEVRIPKVNTMTLGTDSINVCTEEGAQLAITLADNAVTQISAIRAKLGAYQNRLDHAIANLDVSSENITEALSRIEDVNMAEEMSTYTQKNVLAQAGTAMLAQANERPQTILSLIQG